ncbi:MAG: aminopeptidase P family protein [Eubacterium sp.]|nr:aminopeptidase P family protein [Eubacterium sp.]
MAVQLGPYLAAVSDGELERRQNAVRGIIADKGLDAIIAGGHNNALGGAVRYFTDYGNAGSHIQAVVIPKEGGIGFFGHCAFSGAPIPPPVQRGIEVAKGGPYLTSTSFSDDYIPIEMVKFLKSRNARKIGFYRQNSLPYHFVQYILENVDGAELTPIDDEIDYLMAVKSDEELDICRRTVALHDTIYRIIPTILREGRRERDISTDLKKAAFDLGMEEVNNTMICAGYPKAKHKPFLLQNGVVKAGDIVDILIELSGPGGYWGELSRPWSLREDPDPEFVQAVDDAVYMQGELAKLAKPGTPSVEITKALHRFQDEHGYHRSDGLFGHGQGYDMSMRPTFSYDDTMILKENMFISIHPQMDNGRVFAFNTDNFIITKDGAKRVNTTPQGIMYL